MDEKIMMSYLCKILNRVEAWLTSGVPPFPPDDVYSWGYVGSSSLDNKVSVDLIKREAGLPGLVRYDTPRSF